MQYTNHFGFVVDRSGSMSSLSRRVVEVFDAQIKHLRERSITLNQETRVSVYLFDDRIECVAFDMDVMRFESLSKYYTVRGQTALIDASVQAVEEMRKIPELHSDHAFLLYVLTDGQENFSRKHTAATLNRLLTGLPENWTVACLVPNISGKHEAKKFGFPDGNIEIWSVTDTGLETAARTMTSASESFMRARSTGLRSTRSLFSADLSHVSVADVSRTLDKLDGNMYREFKVGFNDNGDAIKDFVERHSKRPYVKGNAFYQISKPETVQGYKDIVIRHRRRGDLYGGANARQLLGLPSYDLRVTPGDHGDWDIFVQSTSVNRKLVTGTDVIVRTR